MEMATPAPWGGCRGVKQIKDVVISPGELGLDPCAYDGSVLGELLPTASGPCHGGHKPGWRADFITTGCVDASAFFIISTTSAFFMPSFVVREGKDYNAYLFSREPGGNFVYHGKVEDYKDAAACKGSNRAYHFGMQPDKEITLKIAGEIQRGGGSFHEKKMETNLDMLHPETNLFPFGTRMCIACPHFL
jgi:hypothetical protein